MVTLNSDGSIPMWMDDSGRPHPVQSVLDELKGVGGDAPSGPHTHAVADTTGLQTALDGKAATHTHPYAATAHGHAVGDTTGLQAALDGKAPTHTHPYAASGHTHTLADGDIPAGIARDAEVTAAIATHAATPHGGEGGGFQFPVGALYLSVDATNPGTVFGYGTWALFGVGRFLVGTDSQAGVTGGSATHTHAAHADVINHTHAVTITDPGHVHDEYRNGATTGGLDGWGAGDTSTNNPTLTGYDTGSKVTGITATTANPAGGVASLAHDSVSNEPPSISAFIWQRTA